tara:strand:- start:143 stop:586 length:444 start_codon:yes stop_codon:yes gene_type:complete
MEMNLEKLIREQYTWIEAEKILNFLNENKLTHYIEDYVNDKVSTKENHISSLECEIEDNEDVIAEQVKKIKDLELETKKLEILKLRDKEWIRLHRVSCNEITVLREALLFYADRKHIGINAGHYPFVEDYGEVARMALDPGKEKREI